MRIYAGIGSREAPKSVLAAMERIGQRMASNGWTLSSGNCEGPDQAFAKGANTSHPSRIILWLPWASYEIANIHEDNTVHFTPTASAIVMAEKYHPNWRACTDGAKKLHARNMHIMLGQDLNSPVEMVVCWTPHGQMIGGTSQALRLAKSMKIPIYNIAAEEQLRALMAMLYCR
jgi:hypothetical protein